MVKTNKPQATRKNRSKGKGGGTLKDRFSSLFTGRKYRTEPEIMEIIPEPIVNKKSDSSVSPKKHSSQNSISHLKTIYERMDSLETKVDSLQKKIDSIEDLKIRYKGIDESFDIISVFMDDMQNFKRDMEKFKSDIEKHPGVIRHLGKINSEKLM
jgi:hypothetical protein